LKISSMKATSAVGRYPSVFLVYSSFSRPARGICSEFVVKMVWGIWNF